jgi:hypothetical protein
MRVIQFPRNGPCKDGLGKKNLTRPKSRTSGPSIGKSTAAHNIWEVDAKEQLQTLDGQPACYLTFTDERSGCWLGSAAFGYSRICQVPIEKVRQKIIEMFLRWGKAGALRVDNGEPLGCPTLSMTPPLALWLIAMDVDMVWNKPRCPQQNAVVERMQSTSARWAEVGKATCLQDLQRRLDAEAVLQRESLPVKRLQGKTRLEAFPQIETSRRVFNQDDFDAEKVYKFLSKKIYVRKVSANGLISHYGQLFSAGRQFKGQFVEVKFDLESRNWLVFDNNALIKTIPASHLSSENIQNLTVSQRTCKSSVSDSLV